MVPPLKVARSEAAGRPVIAGLLSGMVALAANMAMLGMADLVGVETSHGGLLRLVLRISGAAPSQDPGLNAGFHIAVGLGMALAYAVVVAPVLPDQPMRSGLLAAAVVWILNAGIVLPLAGEGFAGTNHIQISGMIWFALAHTAFFLVLAIGIERLEFEGQSWVSRMGAA